MKQGEKNRNRTKTKGRPVKRAAAGERPEKVGRETKKRSAPAKPGATVTFASLLYGMAGSPTKPVDSVTLQAAPLAHLQYGDELALKDKALKEFWQKFRLSGTPEPVIPSPRPRGYRTTSKRRCIFRGSQLHLVFGDKILKDQKRAFLESPLEPPEHARIYTFLQQKLSEPAWKLIAAHLNYLIIRGSYEERVVILNIRKMTGPLVHKLKILAEHLQKQPEPVTGVFAYLDPTGSDYYLESRRPESGLQMKKLYGPAHLSVQYGDCRFHFHPTSFSQVNESIVSFMLGKARELLAPGSKERLVDLYCGYGLFSHSLAGSCKQVVGIDAEGPSIREAQANAKLNGNTNKTRFHARRITPKSLHDLLPVSTEPTVYILDPPRQGPQRGVIEAICEREPGRVLHIFCGVDQIPAAFREWQENGYQVERVVPLDMFSGTANLEVLVLLTRKPMASSSPARTRHISGGRK
ncbi:MAG: class I SAM-dependent RNA methyltransferase [Proteobacteria bacterium]|nr:class I SAM-dependent RNA methyltransferase [Pseudomonadota bacterium]MBU1739124.1 class I SAM-dependent RNA methyltransferase [Pseudomonadota bacterium]